MSEREMRAQARALANESEQILIIVHGNVDSFKDFIGEDEDLVDFFENLDSYANEAKELRIAKEFRTLSNKTKRMIEEEDYQMARIALEDLYSYFN